MIYWIFGIFAFLVIWTLSSFIWIFMSLGRKNEPSRWYDYVLSPPLLAIGYVMDLFRRFA